MSLNIPQSILDHLTNIDMPKHMPKCSITSTLFCEGYKIPLYKSQALVIGSGAAGLRAAVELKRASIDVIVATQSLFWGTSACSGSDKQTLHTAATSKKGDDFIELAQALSSGGAMDMDIAYVEAVGSIDSLFGLKYMGLPLPEDKYGGILRYQTDHDEAGRATSCGPRTSRLMVKVLAEEVNRLEVSVLDHATIIELLIDKSEKNKKIKGAIAIIPEARNDQNPYGIALLISPVVILAAGGPGELFRDSVYPKRCYGVLGLALEVGIETVNLTENQFGISTRRENFPWNLSGTYVQSIPYIYSVDRNGNERNFLADYYHTTQELASNIFRKGYQWPIHASRMLDYGSSLIDLAIFIESKAGNMVYMDFNRNPKPVPNDLPFSLERLDEDVYQYLFNNKACLLTPIERLKQMNPLAIELYKNNGHDLLKEPLQFNVNHQHMNGGIAIDIWGQTSLSGCYAIGEAAGTHGITRPGGAALNAGQVFGIRCAKHVVAENRKVPTEINDCYKKISDCIKFIASQEKNTNGLLIEEVKKEIQNRMSDYAGFICHTDNVNKALIEARKLNNNINQCGLAITHPNKIALSYQCRQLAIASEAVLTALSFYIKQGGGSRGARALCSSKGTLTPKVRSGTLTEYCFLSEKEKHKKEQIVVTYNKGKFKVRTKQIRILESLDNLFFEKNWADYLLGNIYK